MQFVENLSDRQAAEATRSRIDWKYALSLPLTDPGFHFSILTEFRQRLIEGNAEQLWLDKLLERLRDLKLLKSQRQRTDSTHILAAVRNLNRLETLGETFRAALNSLATAAPDWLMSHLHSDWFDRYSRRIENYRLPKLDSEREALGNLIGKDGFALLNAIYAPTSPEWLHHIPALEILRQGKDTTVSCSSVKMVLCNGGQQKTCHPQPLPFTPLMMWRLITVPSAVLTGWDIKPMLRKFAVRIVLT